MRYPEYAYETPEIEDIMDDLRESGCPESELEETARMLLSEVRYAAIDVSRDDSGEENPFWEGSGIEADPFEAVPDAMDPQFAWPAGVPLTACSIV